MTDNNNSLVMPVSPMYGGGNGGFGGWGSDIWLILIVLFAFGGWGNGFGGGFGGGYGNMMLGYDFPWLLNGQSAINANTNNGFQNALLNDNITSIRDGVSALSTQLCGCCGDMQMALNNGFANAETAANARQIANMQTAFAGQNAMNQGFNSLGMNLQNCCCEQRAGIADVKYTLATEACATRNTDTQNTQNILNVINGGIQSIKDQLCQDKIDAKNDTISQLRSELLYARGQASQDVQTAAIQAGQRALANEVEQYVAPKAIPAYVVQNPNCCYNNGCGCGSF